MPAPQANAETRIPVTLLTGFLGSGKTTLLNRLVRQPGMRRTLVVINEFGEIGLDHQLFSATRETQLVSLDSGCACCTVRGDLVRTLREVVGRFCRAGERQFDRLIIETTGLADPAPIVHTLITDRRIARTYRLDGIVTTVDAAHGLDTLDTHAEAAKQVALADRLLITKSDRAGPETRAALRARLDAINATAGVIEATHGAIDARRLTGLGVDHARVRAADVDAWLGARDGPSDASMTGLRLGAALDNGASRAPMPRPAVRDTNRHDTAIRAHCVTRQTPIDPVRLESWLELMTTFMGERMLRVKGMLDIAGEQRPMIIHAVQHIVHPPTWLPAWPDTTRQSRLVFITRDIPQRSLDDLLAALY